MPRKSPEARSAAHFRAGGRAPAPPPHLDAESKKIWRSIAASKPVDYFTTGSLPLLEAYCRTLVMHRYYAELWYADAINRDRFTEAIVKLNASLSQLSTKLRLAITSVDRRSGILTESGDDVLDADDSNVTQFPKRKGDLLFGAGETKW